MRTLLAEDDEGLAEALSEALFEQRYVVDIAADGETALEMLELAHYDLAILDVMLPKVDGINLCRRLRARGNTLPILLLTARDRTTDKVLGLDAGADDYLVKPVDFEELAARLRALLRRNGLTLAPVLRSGGLTLDPNSCEVTYDGRLISLTPKEYSLLDLFLRNGRRVLSRACILDHLWSFDEPPEEGTVKAHVKGLRHKLKAAGAPELIETVYGLGYRLHPPPPASSPVEPIPDRVQQRVLAALAATWERSKPGVRERLGVLDEAGRAMVEKGVSGELRLRAEGEAHKLAGLLGTLGLAEGSRLARELEHLLHSGLHLLGRERAVHFAELVVALHREIERFDPHVGPAEQTPLLLLAVHSRPTLFEPWLEALATRGLATEQNQGTLSEVRRALDRGPDVVLLDLRYGCDEVVCPSVSDAARTLLIELSTRNPAIPVVVIADHDSFEARLETTRLGSGAFLHGSPSTEQVLEAVHWVTDRNRTAGAKVMIVDDDSEMLALLRVLLEPWGLRLATEDNPLRFWQVLEAFEPQLLVLDVEMPNLGGVELCRVVRADPRWHTLPVLFLTAHTDPGTVERVFAGGADDFLSKPVSGPQLATRILDRLARSRPETGTDKQADIHP